MHLEVQINLLASIKLSFLFFSSVTIMSRCIRDKIVVCDVIYVEKNLSKTKMCLPVAASFSTAPKTQRQEDETKAKRQEDKRTRRQESKLSAFCFPL